MLELEKRINKNMTKKLEDINLNGREALAAAGTLILKYREILEDKNAGCSTFVSWIDFDPAVAEDWFKILKELKKARFR